MAKKKNTPVTSNNKKEYLKAQREHYDNQVVIATAIALVTALFLLYLNNYLNSAYAHTTRNFIKVLFWGFDIAVVVFLAMFIWKKNKSFLKVLAYCVAGALIMSMILYFPGFLFTSGLAANLGVFNTTKLTFTLIYICIGIYLVASYVYFGIKIAKLKK